jgi:hypothetical protein
MRKLNIKPAIFLGLTVSVALFAFTMQKRKATDLPAETTPCKSPVGYRWVKQTDNAAFKKSYNFDLFAINNQLWAFHPDGNYYSADGKNWSKSGLPNSIYNLAFMNYVQFNNSILGLGHFEGNIERFSLTTPITQTKNLQNWTTLAKESNLPKRFFYQPVVFNNKIWIFGGTDDGNRKFDDSWSSADGVNWTQEATHLPFGARDRMNFVVFNDQLFMLDNDVWTSGDGIHWKQLSKNIADVQLSGFTPVVFDGKIWLLGCNRNREFTSEILVSSDGLNWEKQDAPWTPRGGIAACVYNGKLYMTGGKYGGFKEGTTETEFVYSNDVWSLEKF